MSEFTASQANAYAAVALANVRSEYPNHVQHLMTGAADAQVPRRLHPAFYGSYDWHSSVHMHWLLVACLHRHRRIPLARTAIEVLNEHLSAQNIAAELAYLRAPGRETFERPYGWAWLLKLAHEAEALAQSEPVARTWATALAPLAQEIASRWRTHLPKAHYPQRAGSHGNSAFALGFALEWASRVGDRSFVQAIRERAEIWFGRDKDYPARYEPCADDFLSPGLSEAVLLQQLMPGLGFSVWWGEFHPKGEDWETWLTPAQVGDRSDAKLAHLDGLNLTRAWCMRRLLPALPPHHALAFQRALAQHLEAALPHVVGGPYVGSHWLASFAVLALGE